MQKLKIICFGKMAEIYKPLIKHYFKRVRQFAQLEIQEYREILHKNKVTEKHLNTLKLLEVLEKEKAPLFLLTIEGKSLTSLDLAKLLKPLQEVTFVIGPSEGFEMALLKRYPQISFSKLTFPHQLFRVLLMEQLYRALSINFQHPYHK